jgi:hypothetical protein
MMGGGDIHRSVGNEILSDQQFVVIIVIDSSKSNSPVNAIRDSPFELLPAYFMLPELVCKDVVILVVTRHEVTSYSVSSRQLANYRQ